MSVKSYQKQTTMTNTLQAVEQAPAPNVTQRAGHLCTLQMLSLISGL
jgi:hypothetical protein